MTAIQLRANLFEEIVRNAENEEILQKVLDFFRSLTSKKVDPAEMIMTRRNRRPLGED